MNETPNMQSSTVAGHAASKRARGDAGIWFVFMANLLAGIVLPLILILNMFGNALYSHYNEPDDLRPSVIGRALFEAPYSMALLIGWWWLSALHTNATLPENARREGRVMQAVVRLMAIFFAAVACTSALSAMQGIDPTDSAAMLWLACASTTLLPIAGAGYFFWIGSRIPEATLSRTIAAALVLLAVAFLVRDVPVADLFGGSYETKRAFGCMRILFIGLHSIAVLILVIQLPRLSSVMARIVRPSTANLRS